MKSLFIALSLLLASPFLSGQSHPYCRAEPEALPDEYVADIKVLRNRLLSRLPSDITESVYAREALQFCDFNARNSAFQLSSGSVFSDWPEMEDYLNNVLAAVVPKGVLEEFNVRPILNRGGSFNAAMNASGLLYLNVGVWAELDSEAALASILAHEVAHVYLDHSFQAYMAEVHEEYDLGVLVDGDDIRYSDSRKREAEADSLAHVWIGESDYSMKGMVELLLVLQRGEDRAKYRLDAYENRFETPEATTHPLSKDRYDMMKKFRLKDDLSGEMAIVSAELFEQFKTEAISETLDDLLTDSRYRTAIDLAFRYHLFDPDNEMPVYYLMEAIRRLCVSDPLALTDNFISSGYRELKQGEHRQAWAPIQRHLFEAFEPNVLIMSTDEYRRIAARFYWQDEVKFKTYGEAFLFFAQVGELLKCKECIFSEALWYYYDEHARDEMLREYLSHDDTHYAELAQELLDHETPYGRRKKKLTVMERTLGYVRQGPEYIPLAIENTAGERELTSLLDSVVSAHPDREFIYLPDLAHDDMAAYTELKRAMAKMTYRKSYLLERSEHLHLSDPQLASLFIKYDVENIEFIKMSYTEFKKKTVDTKKYYEDLEKTVDDVLMTAKMTRYLDFYSASLRLAEEGDKWRILSRDERQIRYKDTTRKGIIDELKAELSFKDADLRKHLKWVRESAKELEKR